MALKKQRHNIWLTATISDVLKARIDAPSKKSTTIEDLIQKGLRWEKEQLDNTASKAAAIKPVDLEPLHQELARITTQLVTIKEQQKQAAAISETHNATQENANKTIIDATKMVNNNLFVMYQRTERMEKHIIEKIPFLLNTAIHHIMLIFYSINKYQKKNSIFTPEEVDEINKLSTESSDKCHVPVIKEKPVEIKK